MITGAAASSRAYQQWLPPCGSQKVSVIPQDVKNRNDQEDILKENIKTSRMNRPGRHLYNAIGL